MFGIYDQLPTTDVARRSHIEALKRVIGDPQQKDILDHLYGCLSIIDSKCSSLLANNSILMAVYAVFMSGSSTLTGPVIVTSMWLGIGLLIWSSILLMRVVWIYWSTTSDLSTSDKQIDSLLAVRATRTIQYRSAWWFSLFSLFNIVIAILLHQSSKA